MATSTPAKANSPANISPVGPPPAITTACSVIVPPISVGNLLPATMMQHVRGLAASPVVRYILKWEGSTISFRLFGFERTIPLPTIGAALAPQTSLRGEFRPIEQQT